MNLTHTVGDIRNFINAFVPFSLLPHSLIIDAHIFVSRSRPENRTRTYTIGTTFPNRILENLTETIEAAKLQNSVIVQRWA